MARPTAYLFCRYQIVDESERPLSIKEEWQILQELKGETIAYRVREPTREDYTTYLMRPRKKKILGYDVHTWAVAQDIRFRERTRYDRVADETVDDSMETDEIRHARFLALPSLGVFAVEDGSSERNLSARSAVGRFVAIIETLAEDYDITVNFAGTPQDAERALEHWSLDQFSFIVRPFNPTPSKFGRKIHELLVADNVGALRAVAIPDEAHDMRDSHKGIIAEARGLSDEGYGQYGAAGTTPDGLRAKISRPQFSQNRAKNKQRQTENRTLKVYIPAQGTAEEKERALIRALVDLYGN
jgi:hypothetical protein